MDMPPLGTPDPGAKTPPGWPEVPDRMGGKIASVEIRRDQGRELAAL